MFFIGKSGILNALVILRILQKFLYKKGPEYLHQLPFDVLPKQTICEIKALQVYMIS